MKKKQDSVRSYFTGRVLAHNILQKAGVDAYKAVDKIAEGFVGKKIVKKDGCFVSRFRTAVRMELDAIKQKHNNTIKGSYRIERIALAERSYLSTLVVELKALFFFERKTGDESYDVLPNSVYINGYTISQDTQCLEILQGEKKGYTPVFADVDEVVDAFYETRDTAIRLHKQMQDVEDRMPAYFRHLCFSLQRKEPRDLYRMLVI